MVIRISAPGVVVLATTCVAFVAPAAAAPAGTVEQTATGIVLHLPGGGTERIDVRGDRIIQVQYVASGTLTPRQTLSVTARWPAAPAFTLTQAGTSAAVRTAKVAATVDTTTGLVSYADANGNPLTAEQSKTFGTSPSTAPGAQQQVDTTFSSPAGEGLFGLGQQQDGILNHKGHQVTLDQFNVVGIGGEIGIPVMMSSRGYGLLWDTYSRSHFYGDINNNTAYRFSAESDSMVDYYFMFGPDLDTVVSDYRQATGTAPMFPQWSFGLFQSKDRYLSQAEVQTVADSYRSNNIPLDAIVQDWQYWNPSPWGSHIMNPSRYPDPKGMLDHLHAENVHGMISVWGKFDPGSDNYNQLHAAGCFYSDSRNGSTYGNYYDAYSEDCRSIYWSQIQQELFDNYGWDALWMDASEWEAPAGVRAYVSTAAGPGVDFYNAYPLEHSRSAYEGERADPANRKRVFTLTRSAYAGQQRNAAASWSGDTTASFSEFANQIPGGLNFSLSGMPYWTEDIGGYFSGDWTTAANNELFTRWFEKGVFDPVFRIHGKGARELYGTQWNAQTKAALLASDQLRYRLMPYIYSLAGMVTQKNYTIMRPLVMDFQNDPQVYSITDEYMFGPSLLVAPVTTAGATARPVYVPSGLWYDFWTGQALIGGQTIIAQAPYDHIPLYVRAGSIIPMGPLNAQYAAQAANPTEVRVYPGANGQFTHYSDAGDTYAYAQGAFQYIPLSYDNRASTLTMGAASGSYPGMPATRNLRAVFVHPQYGAGIAETPSAPTSTYHNTSLSVTSTYTGANVGQTIGPPVAPPATVVTTVTNAGPGTARQVSTQLTLPSGFSAQAAGAASATTLDAGQILRTTWTVTSTSGVAITSATLSAHTTYTAPDGSAGTLDSPATIIVTSPVLSPYRTAASTQAYFGQSGGTFAIDASGADIFKNGTADDDYGAIYLAGGASNSTTATVHVDSQQNTDPWAKAGLVMRNDLTKDHASAGYVVLVTTPGNGVTLQWDGDNDGILDTFVTTSATVTAPVWLKLTRSGATYTASYSRDNATWSTVGTATVTSAASSQDVGMIATSHSSGQTGLDFLSGFSVSVQPPFQSTASTQAYFGRSGNSFAIVAAGADIFLNGTEANDDYGAIYLTGGASSSTTATVHIDSQQNTHPWAKAGLVMRNDLTKDHVSAGYVALVTTPGHGVSLQWDSNNDGIIDNFVATSSTIQAPVWLKFTRSGTTYTGSYSTDNATWTTVGTATITSAAASQDVGMIATSHNSGVTGLNTFSNFAISHP